MKHQATTIGAALAGRLADRGVTHVFGVPGDYNMEFLDQIIAEPRLQWVGCCSELGAGYAADGYARQKGLAALVTTFGVGEMSAINAIAGSFAEGLPVIHVVGTPSSEAVRQHALSHHSLLDKDFDHFARCFQEVSAAHALLDNPSTALDEIDRVLSVALRTRRPGYIRLPSNMAYTETVNTAAPSERAVHVDAKSSHEAAAHLAAVLHKARKPLLILDIEMQHVGMVSALDKLVRASGLPFAVMASAKNMLPEDSPQFVGIFQGKLNEPYVADFCADVDCVIALGAQFVDLAVGSLTLPFTQPIVLAHVHADSVRLENQCYEPIHIHTVLGRLTESFTAARPLALQSYAERCCQKPHSAPSHENLTQAQIWPLVASHLRAHDVVLVDVGTVYPGIVGSMLPAHVQVLSAPLWGAIGWSVPALYGSLVAAPDRRHILLVGDGALQMTAPELSRTMQAGFAPLIVVINNGGYTIERFIRGKRAPYNDIPAWDYGALATALSPENPPIVLHARTSTELQTSLTTALAQTKRTVLLEIHVSQEDATPGLMAMGKAMADMNYASPPKTAD